MDRAMRLTFAAGVTLLVSGLAFMGYLLYLRNNPPSSFSTLPGTESCSTSTTGGSGDLTFEPDWTIPPFSQVDHTGAPVNRSLLEGRISIVWFMYSNCPILCPAMTAQAAALQKRLSTGGSGSDGVQFVAFTLDPAHDRPAALRAFGDSFDVNWSNWTFITEPDDMATLSQTGRWIYANTLQRNVEDNAQSKIGVRGQPGASMDEIVHGPEFFLVGPDAKVVKRGWFNSTRPDEIERLRERAADAAEELRRKKSGASR